MNAVTTYFSPFFDFAKRKLGLAPHLVQQYLDHGATASINGRVIELRYRDDAEASDHVTLGRAGFGHTAHALKWVNQFNARAASK